MSDRHLWAEMRIVFRTDASLQIGTGHVMRCLTLADSLRERGTLCRFICREHTGNLINLIRQRGYSVHVLPCDEDWLVQDGTPSHSVWLGSDWKADANLSKVGTGDTACDWLIVDHYALDRRWEQAMRPHCHRLMVIDDLADRPHDCDLLLDQNLGRSAQDYGGLLNNPDAAVLIGTHYALLRPEFAKWRAHSLKRRAKGEFKNLLITMGGVDKDNATGRVLEALKKRKLPGDIRITVVMGTSAPWLLQVQGQTRQMPWPTQVLVGVSNMAELMANSDLAIGAAGSTSWERCCVGLPTLMLVLAENQRAGAAALQNSGAALVMQSTNEIAKLLDRLQTDQSINENLKKMSEMAAAITQGSGVIHIAEQMTGGALCSSRV